MQGAIFALTVGKNGFGFAARFLAVGVDDELVAAVLAFFAELRRFGKKA